MAPSPQSPYLSPLYYIVWSVQQDTVHATFHPNHESIKARIVATSEALGVGWGGGGGLHYQDLWGLPVSVEAVTITKGRYIESAVREGGGLLSQSLFSNCC